MHYLSIQLISENKHALKGKQHKKLKEEKKPKWVEWDLGVVEDVFGMWEAPILRIIPHS